MNENFEYIEDIIGCLKNKFLPLKYAYIKNAAEYHTKFAQSENYDFAVVMEQVGYKFIFNHLDKEINYIEIGADDGIKSIKLIDLLYGNKIKINNYCFLDFSDELLSKCKKTMTDRGLRCNYYKCDIENLEDIHFFKNNKSTLFVFIGNTLGNVEDEKKVLRNFYKIMGDTDYLLLGVTLRNNNTTIQQELQIYNNMLFTDSVLAFLNYIGIKTTRNNFFLYYNEYKNMIIGEYEILEPFIWDNEIILKTGDKVRCFQSKRYTFNECKSLFKTSNMKILDYYIDTEEKHALFLLKKHEQ